MANMGYVRFENTLSDLEDCAEHLNDRVSVREAHSRKALIALAQRIVDEAEGDLMDRIEVEDEDESDEDEADAIAMLDALAAERGEVA